MIGERLQAPSAALEVLANRHFSHLDEQPCIDQEEQHSDWRHQCIERNALVKGTGRVEPGEDAVAHEEVEVDAEESAEQRGEHCRRHLTNREAILWHATAAHRTDEHDDAHEECYASEELGHFDYIAKGDTMRQHNMLENRDVPAIGIVMNTIV